MIYQVIVVGVGIGADAELDVHFNSTSTRVFRCQIKWLTVCLDVGVWMLEFMLMLNATDKILNA